MLIPAISTFGKRINPPSRTKSTSQRGRTSSCGRYGSIVASRPLASSAAPFRTSRSRMPAAGVSMVTTNAVKPAARARAIAARATSRPPIRYTWYQHGPRDAACTSSRRVPESVDSA